MRCPNTCRWFLIVGAVCVLPASDVSGQGLLERLEQRVRQRIDGARPAAQTPDGIAAQNPQSVSPASAESQRMMLGLEAEERGASAPYEIVVNTVRRDTPGARAGFRPGDVILSIEGRPISTINQIAEIMDDVRPGDRLRVVIERRGQSIQLTTQFPGEQNPDPQQRDPRRVDPQSPVVQPVPTAQIERPPPGSGRLGVTVENVSTTDPGPGVPVRRGAVVVAVAADSPAGALRIRRGDVIVAVDGFVIQEASELIDQIAETVPGQTIELAFYRGNELVRTNVRLAGPPGESSSESVPGALENSPRSPPSASPEADSTGSGVLGGIGSALGGLFGAPSEQAPSEQAPSEESAPERSRSVQPGNSGAPSRPAPEDALEVIPETSLRPIPDPAPDLQQSDTQSLAPAADTPGLASPPMLQVPPFERALGEEPRTPPPPRSPPDGVEALQEEIRAMRERLRLLERRLNELQSEKAETSERSEEPADGGTSDDSPASG